jgi:hypothetical protein
MVGRLHQNSAKNVNLQNFAKLVTKNSFGLATSQTCLDKGKMTA